MTGTGAWLYPHDLQGLPDLMPVVKESTLDTVCVAVRYHSLLAVSPTNPLRRVFELPRTALYFTPDEAVWGDAALQPAVSPSVGHTGDALTVARSFCDRAGTSLTAWIVGLHADDLVRDRPDLAVETVTGYRLCGAPCLNASEVRDFAQRLVRDVAARADAVQLESMHWTPQPHARHVKIDGAAPRLSRLALSVCFCERCRDAARRCDVDADAVAGSLLSHWSMAWDARGPDDPALVSGLDDYLAIRRDAVTDLLRAIVTDSPVPVEVVQFGDPQLTGATGQAAESAGAAVRLLAYGVAADVERELAAAANGQQAASRAHVGLSILPEHARNQVAAEDAVAAAAAGGAESMRLYHAGLAGPRRRAWLPSLAQTWRDAMSRRAKEAR